MVTGRKWSLQAKEKDLRRHQTCQHLDLGPPVSRTLKNTILSFKPPSSVMFCHGSPSRLTHHSKCGLWINRTRMTWELVRNTESQAPPQTMGTRICIFTRSPCALRSPALEKAMATHSSTLAWKLPWTRSLVGCSPQGREESDMTK